MTFEEFKASTKSATEPAEIAALPGPLRALWHDARGDWDGAHVHVQDDKGSDAAWVHAYLHRKEGDDGNAAYWYMRARQPVASGSLDAEWNEIAQQLLRH